MKYRIIIFLILALTCNVSAQDQNITLVHDEKGHRLEVNGKPFMVNGMNWDYYPIGTNYEYSLWSQSDETIRAALKAEMTLIQKMGVNTLRQYTGIPARWISHIYEEYGIYTMLNHSFGRYGVMLDEKWIPHTDYADPRVQEVLLQEVEDLAQEYQNTAGVLLFLLGNENNYGLFWEGGETEDIPESDPESRDKARSMYQLFNKAALTMKATGSSLPIALCNGDLMFLDIIVEECPDIDIFGTNIYRGLSFTDAYARVKKEYGKPVLLTEFGADAYHAIDQKEDQETQAKYAIANWKEVYLNAAGLSGSSNSIGGFTFQFADGWWKYGQTINLDVHDNNASWANAGYSEDFTAGRNNMNEEWFGICAKGKTDKNGLYTSIPRAAYYVIQEVHRLNPYARGTTEADIKKHFTSISIKKARKKASKKKRKCIFLK